MKDIIERHQPERIQRNGVLGKHRFNPIAQSDIIGEKSGCGVPEITEIYGIEAFTFMEKSISDIDGGSIL